MSFLPLKPFTQTLAAALLLQAGAVFAQENPPTPPGPDLSQARQAGAIDGQPDGAREGSERGGVDGTRDGLRNGDTEGYRVCFERERSQARDAGYASGFRVGEQDGIDRGIYDGNLEGEREGESEGVQLGRENANRDAYREAEPRGRAQGEREADATDAEARGHAAGLLIGDARALQSAIDNDYPAGRREVYDAKLAEEIREREDFALKPALLAKVDRINSSLHFNSRKVLGQASKAISTLSDTTLLAPEDSSVLNGPNPDFRYRNYRRGFATPEEIGAYRQSYDAVYGASMGAAFGASYQAAVSVAFKTAEREGCRRAQRENYQRFYDDAKDLGKRDGYARTYRSTFDRVKRATKDRVKAAAAERTYRETYGNFYAEHLERARLAAFERRSAQLYKAGKDRGDRENFAIKYPIYAAEQRQRGIWDELEDFVQKPVRLLKAEVTETVVNGVFEPGEALRLRVELRNFAQTQLAARDIALQVQALDSGGVVISEPEAMLLQDLKAQSLNRVSEALEFRLNESTAGRTASVLVTGTYQGRNIGQIELTIPSRFLVSVAFAETPRLQEGLPTKIMLKLKNNSRTAATGALDVFMLSNSGELEVIKGDAKATSLASGSESLVEFTVIARTPLDFAQVPLAFSVNGQSGRRVGMLASNVSLPVANDYRVRIVSPHVGLRSTGINRLEYHLRNVGSRLLYKGLQLEVKVLGENAENFAVLGPKPQYLTPLDRGGEIYFTIPVLSRSANSGGVLELSVFEDGRLTVVHRLQF